MSFGFIGVLMLDTAFPRPVGDIGNRNSFPDIPMRFARVPEAKADRVLSSAPATGLQSLFPAFLKEALILQSQGALGITTSCGFLAPLQQAMAAQLDIPVALSSLLQIAWVQSLRPPDKVCGVITIDAERLTTTHLTSVGAAASTPIVGMPPKGAFAEFILSERSTADFSGLDKPAVELRRRIEAELIAASRALPGNTGAIVLECTNLPPYREALRQHTRLPIYDVQTLIRWFWAGLSQT